jgi:hypothetical protein
VKSEGARDKSIFGNTLVLRLVGISSFPQKKAEWMGTEDYGKNENALNFGRMS